MAVFDIDYFNFAIVGYYVLSGDTPPTIPIDFILVSPEYTRLPIFRWLSSLDAETDILHYELGIYDSSTSSLVASGVVSGLDISSSYLSSMRASGMTSPYTLSTLSSLSAFVYGSWMDALGDGSYFAKVRAWDDTQFGDWSSDLFFAVSAPVDPAIFNVIPKHAKNDLYWENPSNLDFKKTVISFSTTTYPDEHSGTVIVPDSITPGSIGTFTHADLTPGITYYYTAMSYDTDDNITYVQRLGVPLAAAGASNLRSHSRESSVLLSWDNPSSTEFPNFNGVIVRASAIAYPSTITDGDLVYQGKGNFCYHNNLVDGTIYYYSVWTIDTFNEAFEPPAQVTGEPKVLVCPNGTLLINNGDAVTYSTQVELKFIVENDRYDLIDPIMISNYPDFRDATWQPFFRKQEWTLLFEEGTSHVYFKFLDNYGNVSPVFESSIYFSKTWITMATEVKAAIKGTSDSVYGVGTELTSSESVALYADGYLGDLLLFNRRIKTGAGNGIITVDSKPVSKYRVYDS